MSGPIYCLADRPRILWNPTTRDVTVELMGGPAHQDKKAFPMWLDLNDPSDAPQDKWVRPFLEFVTIAVRDGVPVESVHRELCKVREYTEHLSHDTHGATFSVPEE